MTSSVSAIGYTAELPSSTTLWTKVSKLMCNMRSRARLSVSGAMLWFKFQLLVKIGMLSSFCQYQMEWFLCMFKYQKCHRFGSTHYICHRFLSIKSILEKSKMCVDLMKQTIWVHSTLKLDVIE
jgi:hypothetical protein